MADWLQGVDVLPTDGSQAQCFYHAVGTALGLPSEAVPMQQRRHWPEIERLLREALSLVHDAALLQRYGFSIDSADADEAAMRLAKERYLSSVDFQQQQWGGSLEMLLLSHQSRGALAFDIYNSTSSMHWSRLHADGILLDAAGEPLPPAPLTRVVVLHACAYRGGGTINHFELLQFRLAGRVSNVWQHDESEPPLQRDHRTRFIADACDRARILTKQAAQTLARKHAALAAASAEQLRRPLAAPQATSWWRRMEQGLPSLHPALQTHVSAQAAALCGRGQATRVEVRVHEALSRAAYGKPLQLGLFATSAHARGERITPYGGILRHSKDYAGKKADDPLAIKSHSRRVPQSNDILDGLPLACMYRRPLATAASVQQAAEAGIAALEPSLSDFSTAQVQLFRSSAFGFMANTSRPQMCNARVVYIPVHLGSRGDVSLQVPWLQATRAIESHEEILCAYGSYESKQLLLGCAPLHSRSSSIMLTPMERRRTFSDCPAESATAAQSRSPPRRAAVSSHVASPSCFTPQRCSVAGKDLRSPSCFTPPQPSQTAREDELSPCCYTPPTSSAPPSSVAAAARSAPLACQSLHACFTASAQPAPRPITMPPFPRSLLQSSTTLPTIEEEFDGSDYCLSHDEEDFAASPEDRRGARSALPAARRSSISASQQQQLPPRRAMVIRTLAQARKLPHWETHFAPLTAAQCREIERLYREKSGWWKGAAAPLAKPTPAATEAAASAAAAAVNPPTRKCTSNRWYHPTAIAQDWAEYRSCCGSFDVVALQLAGSATAKEHSSANVLNFFSVRLAYRALSRDRAAFAISVQSQLARSSESERSVLWDGGLVCVSCFRAALGLSRATIYAHRHLQLSCDGDGEGVELSLTPFGSLRQPRQRFRSQHVEALLLEYASSMGQVAPNPKGKNHDHQHIYLPHSRVSELAAALNRMDNAGGSVVKESTLRRVIAHLAFNKYRLSLKPSNSMCRCEHCDLLDGQAEEHRTGAGRNKRLYRVKIAMKEAHLRQVKEQRDHFDAQKEAAEKDPTKLWCFTFDGMDQNKTQLPHLKGRMAKNLDGLPRLGVHAVGAFCFGAPVPVMGFLNFPDVRKDGSLSVAILDHGLSLQFERMEQEQPTDHSRAEASCSSTDGAATAAEAGRRVYRSGVGLHWPERLHVTFDNAAGDAKNQWMFRYLGLLVLHGVFNTITVSTLIVGHTHDIVDQMFSVWAKLLCITDCKTYEQMRRLFHEKYHSRVRLLIKLMTGEALSVQEAQDAGIADAQQAQELADDLAAEQAANPDQWSSAALRYAEQLEADLQRDAAAAAPSSPAAAATTGEQRPSSSAAFHTPHVVRQTHSFNMRSFFESMSLPSGRSVVEEYPMKGQGTPHVFGVEADADGSVWLYNKHLIKSTDKSQRGERHLFRNRKTGDYTSRCLLFRAQDAAYTTVEPRVNPPEVIEVAQLRNTIRAFAKQGKLDAEETQAWAELLDSFEAAQARLSAHCSHCANFMAQLNDIGTVSNRKDMSAAERDQQRAKQRQRTQARAALEDHLRDEPHTHFVGEHAFLGKWLQRVKRHIRPGYIERGVQDPSEYRSADYHVHPPTLCTDGRAGNPDNLLFETDERMDAEYLLQQGPPQMSYFALVRCADAREPFGFGQIHHVFASGEVQPTFVHDPAKEAGLTLQEMTDLLAQSEAAGGAAAGESREPAQEMVLHDASGELLQQQLDKHSKGRETVNMRAIPNVMLEWYNYPSSDVSKLRLLDDEWWAAQATLHAAEDDAVRVRPESAPPARAWVVDMYKEIRFQQQQLRHRRFAFIKGSQLLGWHIDKKHFLKADHSLRTAVFKSLRHDLTEQVDAPARASRRQGIHAAAAQSSPAATAPSSCLAAAQREESDVAPVESDSDFEPSPEEMQSPAATPQRSRRQTPQRPSYTEEEEQPPSKRQRRGPRGAKRIERQEGRSPAAERGKEKRQKRQQEVARIVTAEDMGSI